MPTHGQAPGIDDLTVEGIARVFTAALEAAFPGRPVVVAGESIGGLVALSMAGGLSTAVSCVAFDPPFTTAKLWPVYANLEFRLTDPAFSVNEDFLLEIFGARIGRGVEDKSYFHLLDRTTIPIHVVTGDIPLMPPRELPRPPALIDENDKAVLRTKPNVTLHIVPGIGHLLLTDAEERCLTLLEQGAAAALSRQGADADSHAVGISPVQD